MPSVSMIVMSVLVVAIAILGVLVFLYQKANTIANVNNTLLPFSAAIKPGDGTVFLKNAAGTSQIDCSSVGGKINIVGAWAEVIDPFGSCTGTSASVLNLTCGLRSAKIPCKQDADCGSGMSCSAGICSPSLCPLTDNKGNFDSAKCSCGSSYCPIQPGAPCTMNDPKVCEDPSGTVMYCDNSVSNGGTTGVCRVNPGQNCMAPDPYSGKFCASYPLCSNVAIPTVTNCAKDTDCDNGAVCVEGKCAPKNVVNAVCKPKSTCKPRDASAYLAAKCDGKDTCNLLFDPTDRDSGFGPTPCDIPNQNQLPITPGQGTNYSQGYYVHGLYTCVPAQ